MHVLITGGTGGIGSAMVRLFAQKGHKVSFTYHTSEEKAQSIETECGASPLWQTEKTKHLSNPHALRQPIKTAR